MCIAPTFIAKILKDVSVTIGQDKGTAEAIEAMGAKHVETNHGDVVMDEEKLVFTTPCYMLDATITDIDDGANNVVKAMMEKIG
jgi:enhancing lycopene biosynthesis protein 2